MAKQRQRIAVLCGGPSTEHEVSLMSGRMVYQNLDRTKYKSTTVTILRNGQWRFGTSAAISMARGLKRLRNYNVAFLAFHGVFGEDGTLQALLDATGVRYTGSGPGASAVALNKQLTNVLYEANGFSVPAWGMVLERQLPNISPPVVVKPVDGGSSFGVEIVRSRAGLRRAVRRGTRQGQRLIQKLIKGRELTCGALERNGKPFALPPTEIRPKSSTWFDYQAKYTPGASNEITPAPLTKSQTKAIQELAVKAHELFGCRGMSRSDFIFDGKKFWILETNTIPGLTKTSLLPQGAQAAGISFSGMLDLVIQAALRR